MMIFVYIGLPGSGKTTLALQDKDFLDRLGYTTALLDDASQNGGKEAFLKLIEEPLDAIFLIDTHLCSAKAQESLKEAIQSIPDVRKPTEDWFYFSNEPKIAWANCKKRKDKTISKEIVEKFSKEYYIPQNAYVRPIWREKK